MFCRQCGKEIETGDLCADCKAEIEALPVSGSGNTTAFWKKAFLGKNKKRAIPAVILAAAAVAAMGAFLFLKNADHKLQRQYDEMAGQIQENHIPDCQKELKEVENAWQKLGLTDSDEKKELLGELEQIALKSRSFAEELAQCSEKLDSMKDDLEKYNLSGSEYAAYAAAVDSLDATVRERDIDNLDTGINAADEAFDELIKANDAYVNGKLSEYGKVNLSIAEADDILTYNSRIEEVQGLLPAREYGKISDIFAELDEIYYKYAEPENPLNISVQQIDVTEYPNVRLYLSVTDQRTGDAVQGLDGGMFFVRKKDADGNYIKQLVKGVNQLDETEALNIDIVADVSGSMSGSSLDTAKSVMTSFVNSVQFAAGDMVELISFSNGVYIEEPFTNDANLLISRINGLYTQDMTAFYDALYTAVNKTAARSGAKCVIAFTDGLDNYSSCTSSDVIQLAQRYHIPIFIIGIGRDDFSTARQIALQTGGSYYYVNNIYDIQGIYQQIYRQEKQLYLVEFEDTSSVDLFSESSIAAGYHTLEYGGDVNYTYTPHTLVSVDSAGIFLSGPEAVAAAYMRAFADAMTQQSFSCIEPYLEKGSPIAAAQEKYVQRGISEALNSYEIENVEYLDSDNCVVTTRETYFVQKPGEPLTLLVQRCKYVMKRYESDWKISDFAESVEVLSRIKY